MSDASQGPGWWLASDGRWYPPEQHPDQRRLVAPSQTASGEPPGASAPSWEQKDGSRRRRRLLYLAAAIVVVAGLGAVSAFALSSSGTTSFLGGSGTATITWRSVQSNLGPGGPPTAFSGTIAGVPVQGQSITPLPQGSGSPAGGLSPPTQITLARWTGTYQGESFDLAVSMDLRSGLAAGPNGFSIKVDGSYGSQPVHATASVALAQANALTFDGTIGHHHISGTVRPNGNGANTAEATFVVTG